MPISILVVDDSAMARKMLVKAFPAQWDVHVTQASNGEEALAACRAGTVDVMFLDLTMPVMDGYAVLEALKKQGFSRLVVVVSADIQAQTQARVMALGAAAFAKKPIATHELEAILRQHGVLV